MADEKTGVTVAVTHGAGSDHHERGTDIRVTDGHLYVYRGRAGNSNAETVAVYAPGSWKYATVAK